MSRHENLNWWWLFRKRKLFQEREPVTHQVRMEAVLRFLQAYLEIRARCIQSPVEKRGKKGAIGLLGAKNRLFAAVSLKS